MMPRWLEAESDATKALELDPENMKGFYRRAIARREQGKFAGVREGTAHSMLHL
jgi:hypothetical protein